MSLTQKQIEKWDTIGYTLANKLKLKLIDLQDGVRECSSYLANQYESMGNLDLVYSSQFMIIHDASDPTINFRIDVVNSYTDSGEYHYDVHMSYPNGSPERKAIFKANEVIPFFELDSSEVNV